MSDNNQVPPSVDTQPSPSNAAKPETGGRRKEQGNLKREYVKEFIDANTRIAVRVQKTEKYRPHYSMVVGKLVEHENGTSFVPYIPVIVTTNLAKVQNITDHSKVIAEMIREATDWIRDACQKREDEIIDEQNKKYAAQDSRNQGHNKPGLKTLAKIDRALNNYGT